MSNLISSWEISGDNIERLLFSSENSDNQTDNSHCGTFLAERRVQKLTERCHVISALYELLGKGSDKGKIESLANYVVKDAPRAFLTLVYMGAPRDCLEALRTNGFTDDRLPLGEIPNSSGGKVMVTMHSDGKPKNPQPGSPIQLSKSLKMSRDFVKNQWLFTVPVFRGDELAYEFHKRCRLPFIDLNHNPLHTGHFGTVYRIGLRSDHTDFERTDVKYKSTHGYIEVALKVMNNEQTSKAETDIEKFYNKELSTLSLMRKLAHPHLVPAIAAYKKGPFRCFVFPWARGGNLKTFWETDSHILNKRLVTWAISQMVGISEGLKRLHRYNTRHGDIKPANILYYVESAPSTSSFGTMMVADVGLAKVHNQYTRLRNPGTTTRHGTEMYEPIEMSSYSVGKSISRRYDVWGLGCVFLEFIIWLLYGQKELARFHRELTDPATNSCRFWETPRDKPMDLPRRHPRVDRWMNKVKGDVQPQSAVWSLVDLISTRLLVAVLDSATDPDDDDPTDDCNGNNSEDRATAEQLVQALRYIQSKGSRRDSYYFDSRMETLAAWRANSGSNRGKPQPVASQLDQRTSKLDNEWRTVQDNSWARTLATRMDWERLCPKTVKLEVCESCRALNILASHLSLGRSLSDLDRNALSCPMCRFFHDCLSKLSLNPDQIVELSADNERNAFMLSYSARPAISIYLDPEFSEQHLPRAQVGLPLLPKSGSPQQLRLLNEWVYLCNKHHHCVSSEVVPGTRGAMPTRLVDVGSNENPSLRLIEKKDHDEIGHYIALSHCWGTVHNEEWVCTNAGNVASFRKFIPFDILPKTFQDAITVTRALGARYLWIDSLCIIQGDDKDWEAEAGRMEDVFSSAYCTIAATSSASSRDGFLANRAQRAAIGMPTLQGTVYLAEAIDDFESHVEKGVLNTRGWVLQERALARRTIHFTSTQVYWECGEGVHCETLAELGNRQSMFLGDSNFPAYGLEYYKDERIRLVQYLYQIYSGLNLTKSYDRSKAILGLQKRLGSTFKSTAMYGVISKYFQRTFLWQADVTGSLSRIAYEPSQTVPSWSWMAVMGRIRYMEISFGGVTWTGDLENPFQPGFDDPKWDGRLVAKAKQLIIDDGDFEQRCKVDVSAYKFEPSSWKCVVVGKSKVANEAGDKNQYVLLIRERSSGVTPSVYERVGVGILLQTHVAVETTVVHIV